MLRSGEPLRGSSRLCIPFGIGATANGCLILLGPGAGRLPQPRLERARDLGDVAALAVHRLQAARAQAGQAARMGSLLHAGRSMTSSLVLQDVLDAVAREVVDTFAARYCVIWEYVEDLDALIERAGLRRRPGVLPGRRDRAAGGATQGARDPVAARSRCSRRSRTRSSTRRAARPWSGGREDLPVAAAAVRRRDARSPRDLRDRARAPVHQRRDRAGPRPGQPGLRRGAQRPRVPRPGAAQRRARRAGAPRAAAQRAQPGARLQPRPAGGARLRLPAHLHHPRRQRLRDLGAARRRPSSSASQRGWTERPSRSGAAAGCLSRTGR